MGMGIRRYARQCWRRKESWGACMVPGKMRSQSGGERMSLEEEGLFHTALSFTTALMPSLTWACQVPGSVPMPHVTEGKLCFRPRSDGAVTGIRIPSPAQARVPVHTVREAPSLWTRGRGWGRKKKSLSGGARRHLFLTWKVKHFQQENEHIFLFIHYKNKAWYSGKKMSFDIQMICAPNPALPLLPMSSRERQ